MTEQATVVTAAGLAGTRGVVPHPHPTDRLTRRQFVMATATALALGGSAVAGDQTVKIDRIDIFPVRYPTKGYFKFFTGPHGSQGRAAVLVKVTADNGVIGWGQSVPIARWSYETLETATIVLRDYFAPVLVGRDAADLAGARRALDTALAAGFSTGMPIARAGMDIALNDLLGKLNNRSLAQLWGRPGGGPITLSWTVNPHLLDQADAIIDAGLARGYRNFNIKVAPHRQTDVELARLVRRRQPDGFLWADANGGYDPETALAVAPQLADAGVDVLESPCKPNRIRGYQALKRQGALPILMDEGVVSPVELDEFIHLGMLDGVAMKPSRCGGLESAREQIDLLERNGLMWLGSGLTDPDLSLAASLILYGAYGLKKPAALNGPQFLTADLLKQPLSIAQGIAQVPTGPGLGVEIDEEKLRVLVARTRKTAR